MTTVIENPLAPLQEQLQQSFAERTVRIGEGQQGLREAGRGAAIVLLHGIGSGAASWLQVAMALSDRARVIAWDAPGYGRSTPLALPMPKAGDYARRLGQLLDALAIECCVLVGHSLGALPAAAFAQAHPDRVSRLVLLSPARGYGASDLSEQGQAVRAARLSALEQHGIAQIARERSVHLVSAAASSTALHWAQWNMARLLPQGYRQAIELLCGDDLLRYSPLNVPCEVHCGSADSITRAEACQAVASAFEAPFSLIAGAGHACAIEQPDEVTGRLALALDASFAGGTR